MTLVERIIDVIKCIGTDIASILKNNTGDETTTSIQQKRPLKTINGNSLEGSGNITIQTSLISQTTRGVLYTYNNAAVTNFGTWSSYVEGTETASSTLPYPRLDYTSSSSAGSFCYAYNLSMAMKMSLGFYLSEIFSIADDQTVSGARMFAGITSNVSAPTNVEPSTLTDTIGVAQLSADGSQLYIVYGGSTAQTAIATGIAIPSGGTVHTYQILIHNSIDSSNTVLITLLNLTLNTSYSTTLTGEEGTVLPASTTTLFPRLYRTNNTTASAVKMGISHILLEGK